MSSSKKVNLSDEKKLALAKKETSWEHKKMIELFDMLPNSQVLTIKDIDEFIKLAQSTFEQNQVVKENKHNGFSMFYFALRFKNDPKKFKKYLGKALEMGNPYAAYYAVTEMLREREIDEK